MINKKILFVCLGNICRSPAAEGIMASIVKKGKMEEFITVDSAGTIPYHRGELPDQRMRSHALKRGYSLTHRSRMFDPEKDFDFFDYIVVMDGQNYTDIVSLDKRRVYKDKIFKMVDFCSEHRIKAVPDPYYLGSEGFEEVLDVLEDGCSGLFNKVKDNIGLRT